MQNVTAKIVHIRFGEGNRFYAEAEIVVPDNFEHIELFIDNICRKAHAPPLSDVEAGTHRLSISGEGKSPFKLGQSINTRAFQRGELPA
jgi:hypothetical protein